MELILPLLSSLFHAFATTFGKKAIRLNKPDNFLLFSLVILFLIMLPLSPLFFNVFNWKSLLILLVPIVLLDGAANIIYNQVLKNEELGYCLPLFSTSPFFTVLFSFVLAPSELLPLKKMLALLLIIPSIYLLNVKAPAVSFHNLLRKKENMLLLLSSAIYGFTAIITKYALEYTNAPTLYFLRIGLMTFFIFIAVKGKVEKPKSVKTMFIAQSFYIATFVSYYYAIAQYNLLISATLSRLAPIFVLFTAYFLLKEKITWQKILASLTIIIGILLLR